MRTATIDKHQTIIDVALQECGNADAAFDIAALNGIEITDDIAPGTELLLPDVVDKKKVKYLSDAGLKPITGPLIIDDAQEGLEFWVIERDFVIT
jgi:hypothetical protein